MVEFLSFLQNVIKPKKTMGGFFVGEKVLVTALQEKFVFLASDFVSASKIKKGLTDAGKKVQIISCGRENDDEHDVNLAPFAKAISAFERNLLDGLIFLPSSLSSKFDLNFLSQSLQINVGQEISLENLSKQLSDFGYERVEYVSMPGQFAVRGDVVDIFVEELPTRLEFFDEEVEKIINFDFSTMKTQENLQKIDIFPIFLKFGNNSVVDLCETIFVDEPQKIENECKVLQNPLEHFERFSLSDVDFDKCFVFSNTMQCEFENVTVGQKNYITDFMSLKNDILMYARGGHNVFLFAGEFEDILEEFLLTNNISHRKFDGNLVDGVKVYLCADYFSYSFSFLPLDIIGIGTDDLYRPKRVDFKRSGKVLPYLPKVGDFVVHSFYGVGRCKDIIRMKLSRFEKDYFVLEYKNGALLYLPSEQANLLSAYIGGEDPKLNALGSNEWTKLKQKVKSDLKELAFELAKIYKDRQTKKGFKFVRDEELEREFADSFAFELTSDQVQAIVDVDTDMENGKVMDRLICGDVGFGKTEVAFRAMFKAVYNSKQVAFLCPTTILSEQHFRSSKERFEKFGFRIEVLNRFKTAKETAEIYQRLEEGKIDILIGTHKILNDKIKFKDLGLLVLDEEQRFGVKDKEKIKKMKTDVDVLTLSATPIPRTLNMSLTGIRDISVIATPPRDRLPIQTYVTTYSDSLLQDVVSRELSRKGKALILFNRVEDIYNFQGRVASLLPQASIGVAHGQMEERALARVIDNLYDDKFDVLISTTLIENGIDLPTLNTLFVVDCDLLGLSQLYQIRGRIGRSDKLAYAYLTYDGSKVLTETAYKRLDAIKEFRELGSGFKIATRDLEIRGAGDILGKQQHGHMQKVGYDMYIRLLDEVTKEISGNKVAGEKDIQMELVLDAYISEDYISSQDERIVFYNKISNISSQRDFDDVLSQLQEMCSYVPEEVKNLCKVAYLKNLAGQFNVKKIKIDERECLAYFYKSKDIIDKRLSKTVGFYDACLKFEELPILKLNIKGRVLQKIDKMIEIFSRALQEKL